MAFGARAQNRVARDTVHRVTPRRVTRVRDRQAGADAQREPEAMRHPVTLLPQELVLHGVWNSTRSMCAAYGVMSRVHIVCLFGCGTKYIISAVSIIL